ncbi:hypothetical protein [uncultured Bacteroides sp.]|uniref:hypothetical protein n=1 Tax=uncultured Bacteroides sp. TaxID=162156 RepID=UPI0026107517|nr:hypothetical protein [uncultured Bacteroides sp.]
MTKLYDLLDKAQAKAIAKETIKIGNVYRIKMDRSNGIVPKAGDKNRNKFFVVLGFDKDGNAYGGVIINSAINRFVPQTVRDWHMPIKCDKYKFLEHDSFVDCSKLMCAKAEKFGSWEFKGAIEQEDVSIIINTIKESPNESKAHLALYGL